MGEPARRRSTPQHPYGMAGFYGSRCGAGSPFAQWSRLATLDPMGELGRYGPQLPHDEAAQREHFKEVDEDLSRDQEADRIAKRRSTRPRGGIGYLVVLLGVAGFVLSCFLPYTQFFDQVSISYYRLATASREEPSNTWAGSCFCSAVLRSSHGSRSLDSDMANTSVDRRL